MQCTVTELRYKEVINVCSGHRLGYVSDIQVNVRNGHVVAIIVPGPCKFFGFFGRDDDYIIPWECINQIGDDLILISIKDDQYTKCKQKKNSWWR